MWSESLWGLRKSCVALFPGSRSQKGEESLVTLGEGGGGGGGGEGVKPWTSAARILAEPIR